MPENVPDYHRLSDYLWVESFLNSKKIQEKIDLLRAEYYQIEALPVSKADFLSRCKTSHAALLERVANRLHRYLAEPTLRASGVQDPFHYFEFRFSQRDETLFVPPWPDVEEIIKNLPDNGGIDDAQRKKRFEKINLSLSSLTADLHEFSPATFTVWRGDKVVSDTRLTFVEHWEDIQSQLNAPAGPRALELAASSDAEKNAWRKLGLAAFINPDGLNPNPAD